MRKIIPEFILASKSIGRNKLLKQLHVEFKTLPADIDESQLSDELPSELVMRLSISKGETVLKKILSENDFKPCHNQTTNLIIISSDQVAVFNGKVYGKPGTPENAFNQLKLFNNSTIEFITGLNVINYELSNNIVSESIYTSVSGSTKLRNLSDEQIRNYIEKDSPTACAASLKVEGLGMALLENIETHDFNAIIGLPILELTKILEKMGIDLLML